MSSCIYTHYSDLFSSQTKSQHERDTKDSKRTKIQCHVIVWNYTCNCPAWTLSSAAINLRVWLDDRFTLMRHGLSDHFLKFYLFRHINVLYATCLGNTRNQFIYHLKNKSCLENVSGFSHIALRFFSTSSFRHIAEPVRWLFTLLASIFLISIASNR